MDMINQEEKFMFLSFTVETWLFIFHHNWTFNKYSFCCKNYWRPGREKSYHYELWELAVLGKEVCNGGVACSCLQLRSLEKTVRASLIALWFVLRPPFFLEKKMSHVMLVNDLRRKVMSFFLQKKTQHFFYGAKLIFKLFATFFGLTIFWSGAKQRFLFTDCRSVWNHTGRF